MDIVEYNRLKLTIRHRPLLLWLLSSILAAVGVGVISFQRGSSLTCQRGAKTGSCELVKSGLVGSEVRTIPLESLRDVSLDLNLKNDSNDSYRVVLLTGSEEIPFTSHYSADSNQQESIASEIDAFIMNKNQASLNIQQDDRWFSYLFGSLLIGVGLFVAVQKGKVVTLSFDKVRDRMMLKQRGLLSGTTIELPLAEIVDVTIETIRDAKDRQIERVALVLDSGKHLAITPEADPFWDYKKVAHCIRVFLNLNSESSRKTPQI
ncbi:hypothetical protein [Coleofasciculus sp. G2-EDA-02]|uniref:hypothetical protein n=1 Tax=Coleofasciculus sp. G2-EDA-02 TaxID=3069529 RepID=UPI0032F803B2